MIIIGLCFVEGDVYGLNYLNILQNYFYQVIQEKGIEDTINFQHDIASTHYHPRGWINNPLPNKWKGRGFIFIFNPHRLLFFVRTIL